MTNVLSVLRTALTEAVEDELITRNVLQNWTYQRNDEPTADDDVDPFTPDEQRAVLDALTGQERNLFQFAFWTGLRTSEIIALQWTDVDWSRGTIRVQRAQTRAARVLNKVEKTKTRASRRDVKLLGPALAALTDQKRFTLLLGGVIFMNPRTGAAWSGDNVIWLAWGRAIQKSKVRYRPVPDAAHLREHAAVGRRAADVGRQPDGPHQPEDARAAVWAMDQGRGTGRRPAGRGTVRGPGDGCAGSRERMTGIRRSTLPEPRRPVCRQGFESPSLRQDISKNGPLGPFFIFRLQLFGWRQSRTATFLTIFLRRVDTIALIIQSGRVIGIYDNSPEQICLSGEVAEKLICSPPLTRYADAPSLSLLHESPRLIRGGQYPLDFLQLLSSNQSVDGLLKHAPNLTTCVADAKSTRHRPDNLVPRCTKAPFNKLKSSNFDLRRRQHIGPTKGDGINR